MLALRETWDEISQGVSGWIVYILLGIALAFFLHEGLGMVFSTDYPVVTVKSESMVPTQSVGDIVFTYGSDDYGPGDIVVFDGWMRTPIIHRIVAEIENKPSGVNVETWQNFSQLSTNEMREVGNEVSVNDTVYVTKGDNNEGCDQCAGKEFIKEEDIYGEAIFSVPYLGWVKLATVKLLTMFI